MRFKRKVLMTVLSTWALAAVLGMLLLVTTGIAWWEHVGYEFGTRRDTAVWFFNFFGLFATVGVTCLWFKLD